MVLFAECVPDNALLLSKKIPSRVNYHYIMYLMTTPHCLIKKYPSVILYNYISTNSDYADCVDYIDYGTY